MIDNTLLKAIESAWSRETAAVPETWSPANASLGHCDVSSLVVREFEGGDLKMAQVFRNGELSEHHYWNVLPGGQEVDVTTAQFNGDETFGEPTLMDAAFFAAAGPINPELAGRLDRFRSAVDSNRVDQP